VGLSRTHARHPAALTGHPTVRHSVDTMLHEERARWAMQIHDGLTQSVTSAVLEIQTLRHRIETDPAGAVEALKEIETEIRKDLRRIRELLFSMTSVEPPTAEPTLTAIVREAIERWKLPTRIEVEGDLEPIAEETLEAVFAIVTEGLANVAKHSGAREAHVRVRVDEHELTVSIEDRGSGISEVVLDDDPHFGIRIMHARAQALGGSLQVESTPGHGTTISAVLPVGGQGEVQ
jgi:signal transduction histidine kinase